MNESGAAVQKSIFDHLDGDQQLAECFRQAGNVKTDWPQISFDSLSSRVKHRLLGLVHHEITFSIWSDLRAYQDAADLTQRLINRMESPFQVQGYFLVDFHTQEIITRPNKATLQWRSQIVYQALTQKRKVA